MLSYLPWLFLLACPLMMMFMMRGGMGGGASKGSNPGPAGEGPAPRQPRLLRAGEADARIAQLEREVAALRAAGSSAPADQAAGRGRS